MPRNSKSKKVIAYEILKRRIINNSLTPNEPLNERVLSEELKISKTPIREALQQLEKEGLVENVPHKGSFVSRVSVQDIREIFEVREILECAAARGSALNGDLGKLETIRKQCESIERETGKTPSNLLNVGAQIHNFMFESLENKRLIEIYKGLRDHIERVRIHFVHQFDPDRLEEASKEHREILDSLIARDPSRAEDAVRTHLRNGMEYKTAHLTKWRIS